MKIRVSTEGLKARVEAGGLTSVIPWESLTDTWDSYLSSWDSYLGDSLGTGIKVRVQKVDDNKIRITQ